MSVQPIIVRILVLMWSFMMVGQQVRLCWGDFARGRLGMRLSCRVETKCLWCSILEKQLLVDLKRNMNPQRPVVSTLSSLFWISSFIIFKFSSYASLVLISGEALPGKLCGTPRFIPVKFYSLHESLRVLFVSDDANMDYDGFGATYKLLNHSPPSK